MRQYHLIVYFVPTLILSPPPSPTLFLEKPYTTLSIDIQRITLGSIMYIKGYFLNQSKQQSWLIQKNRMKIMIVNCKIKHKSKTMLGVMRNLVLAFSFLLGYCIYEKVPYTCNITTGNKNTLYIPWRSKKSFMENNSR